MANTRTTHQAGKKPKRRNTRTKTKAKKVLSLSSREPVRTATIKSDAKPAKTLKRKHSETPKEAAVLTGVRKTPAFSFFDSQVQLFSMMLQWSPFMLLFSYFGKIAVPVGGRDAPIDQKIAAGGEPAIRPMRRAAKLATSSGVPARPAAELSIIRR